MVQTLDLGSNDDYIIMGLYNCKLGFFDYTATDQILPLEPSHKRDKPCNVKKSCRATENCISDSRVEHVKKSFAL
jgi:hypothetical protein